MTQSAVTPSVELSVGRPLTAAEVAVLQAASAAKGMSSKDAFDKGLEGWRLYAMTSAKAQVAAMAADSLTAVELVEVLDELWETFTPIYLRTVGPGVVSAYIRAYRRAQVGNVDQALIYVLANESALRTGAYFHESSKEAIVQGFQALVNRKVPARAAAMQVLDAYGLTPRQMSSLVAAQPTEKVTSSVVRDLKAKTKAFIGTAFRQRMDLFSSQEAHNLSMNGAQTAWLWMVQTGQLSESAEKVWYTRKDERVCPVCGPLHGMVVNVQEKFITDGGQEYWVPGAHPRCRCTVKLREPLKRHLQPVAKADDRVLHGTALAEFNQAHPRASNGRFRSKNQTEVVTLERPERNQQWLDSLFREVEQLQEAKMRQTVQQPAQPKLWSEPIQMATTSATIPFAGVETPKGKYGVIPDAKVEEKAEAKVEEIPWSEASIPWTEAEIPWGETSTDVSIPMGEVDLKPAQAQAPAKPEIPFEAPARPVRPRVNTRAVVNLNEEYSRPAIFAAVGPMDSMGGGAYYFEHHDSIRWTPKERIALHEAERLQGELIYEAVQEVTNDSDHVEVRTWLKDINGLSGGEPQITREDAESIFWALANGDTSTNTIKLPTYNDDGEFISDLDYYVADVAQAMGEGYTRDSFQVRVVEIAEAHSDPFGGAGTIDYQDDSNISLSGQYMAEDEDDLPGISIVRLNPHNPTIIEELGD